MKGRAPPQRQAVEGEALDGLAARVRSYAEEHKPEPASFPVLAARVMDVAEHPDVDVGQLAHLIERDPAMCAAVLGVANSALYRRAVAVHSVRTAVTLLGLRQVASLAVGVACRALFDMEVRVQHDLYPVWWNRLFHGAMTEAFAASFVAIERRLGASDAVFLAGMFHDIGKSLVLRSLSAQLVNGAILGIPDDAAIEELLRRLHVPIGVAALRTWNLPEPIARVCETQRDDHVPDGRDWVDAHVIRIVSSLNDLRMGMLETAEPLSIIADSARALDLGRADILAVAGQVSEHAAQVGVLFSVADPADESGYIDFVTRCIEVG